MLDGRVIKDYYTEKGRLKTIIFIKSFGYCKVQATEILNRVLKDTK